MHLTNHKFKMKTCRKEYCWIPEQTINGVRKCVVTYIRWPHLRKAFKDVEKKTKQKPSASSREAELRILIW